jgi:glucosyl-dolichyl phosphate glucuronosyltransferase
MISVVICTYNREPILREMLASFYQQRSLDAIDHEVIVVDNNSSDGTAEAVKTFAGSPPPRYVFEPVQGLSRARNRGISESRGEIVAFLDDDVIVEADWLNAIRRCFDETGADAVGGKSTLLFRSPVPPWLGSGFRGNLSEVDLGDERLETHSPSSLFGVNISFRKSVLTKQGGFYEAVGRIADQLLLGEETRLMKKILADGGRAFYEPRAVVRHIIGPDRLTWEYFHRYAAGEGLSQAILDEDRGRLVEILRVPRAAQQLGICGLKIIAAALTDSDECRRMDLRRRWTVQKYFLRGRCRRLRRKQFPTESGCED